MNRSAALKSCAGFRIAVGSIYQEGNSFVNTRTDLDLFQNSYLLERDELLELGSEAKCREAGKLRVEGRDYVIQDGDVVNFRFNV